MLFVRAPDENVYIPPFNLIEIVLVCTLEWWMDKRRYELVNDWVMGFIYSPLLLVAAWTEKRTAIEIRLARKRGDEDDDTVEEWEQMLDQVDFEAETLQFFNKDVEAFRDLRANNLCLLNDRLIGF